MAIEAKDNDSIDLDRFRFNHLTDAQKLERVCKAILMFYMVGAWTEREFTEWLSLTGQEEVTTRALCNFVRGIRPV